MDAITDLISLAASNVWIYGGSFLLVLSILVVVHEWGHFITARLCGVKVEEFAVGFGKEIYGYNAKSGTRWKLCLLPIGGYVKMFGDSDPASSAHTDQVKQGEAAPRPMTSDERSQAFFSKSVGQRSLIVFAGPAINYLFAILLLTGLYMTQGREIVPPVASAVHATGAGAKAGIMPGDRIVAIDGTNIENFDDLRRSVMLALDTPLRLTIERDSKISDITVVPERLSMKDRFGFKHERGYLGVLGPLNGLAIKTITQVDGVDTGKDIDKTRALLVEKIGKGPFQLTLESNEAKGDVDHVIVNPTTELNKDIGNPDSKKYNVLVPARSSLKEYKQFGLFGGIIEATYQSYRITVDSLYAIGQMISGTRSATELGGVIRIGALAGDMATAGVVALITFTALLSINLGMINLFPVPLLDGGHLVFYAYEAVRGKPLPDHFQEYAFRIGLVILVFVMVFANINDIVQLLL
jgi:regulator of sigma E protease